MLKPKIRVKLAELELKQSDIYKEFEVTQKQFSNWVTGTSAPRLELAFKLAKRLGCKVDDLWEYKEE
ncbi:helix-turn-helix transcriptional regulator [Neobacillus drentensis]|uniref:helix-turn-helix transcriptional regulator n=1 Tax=Neobacillus drentensis TaxID=220684 RepID=UPI0030009F3D